MLFAFTFRRHAAMPLDAAADAFRVITPRCCHYAACRHYDDIFFAAIMAFRSHTRAITLIDYRAPPRQTSASPVLPRALPRYAARTMR